VEDVIGSIFEHGFKIALLLVIIFIALLVHELGHLFAARFLKIPVRSVQIGRGKILFDVKDGKATHWAIHAIPFGANVQISDDVFFTRPYRQRFFVIMAGPLINLFLPFIVFAGFYLAIGQPAIPPLIVGVEQGLIADKAGLKAGDRILEINHQPVASYKDIWRLGYESGAVENLYKIQRGEKMFELKLKPLWSEYRDEDGIDRANARFGILWTHTPLKMKAFEKINGRDVMDKPDLARELLLKNMDRDVILQIKGPDKGPYIYKTHLYAASNPHLNDKTHEEYEGVYLAATRDNFYLRQSALAQISDAADYTLERIGKIAALPFQLLPLDPYAISDEHAVGNPDTRLANHAYAFLHKLAIASIFIGLLNLLPLPYLDGGHIAIQGIEAAQNKPVSRRFKARFFGLIFALAYFSILLSNMDNLPRYIDLKVKKLQDSIHHVNDKQEKG
jgi:regulator of sigma E protease